MKLNKSGQGAMEALLGAVVILIILLVAFIIIDPITSELFDTLQAMNTEEVSNTTTIQTLIGLIPLILTALVIVAIAVKFRQRPGIPPSAI